MAGECCSGVGGAQQGLNKLREMLTQKMNGGQDAQAANKKGQLDPSQMEKYLQQKAAAAQGGQQQFDAKLLAESMKATGIGQT